MTKTLCFLLLLFLFYSCERDAFPIEKYYIDPAFRDMISPYHAGDTLVFRSTEGEIDSFVISKIDSSLYNKKGHFINTRNMKSISVHYRQVPVDYWEQSRIEMGPDNESPKKVTEDASLIRIARYPDTDKTDLSFHLKAVFGNYVRDSLLLHKDTMTIPGLKFSNYYKIEYNSDNTHTPTSIKTAYSAIGKGVVAYQYVNGTWWVRVK